MRSKENKTIPRQKLYMNMYSLGKAYEQISDAQLWEYFREGDKKAFDLIYDRHFQSLCWYGDKICQDKALVEDVVQDLFIYLWTRRIQLGPTDAIKFYLFRCLRRKLLRTMEQEGKRLANSSENMDFALELSSIIEVNTEEEERKLKLLAGALHRLTDRQREAIYLKFYNNLSFQEVATVMNIEVRSLYNLIGRTIDILREDFKENKALEMVSFTLIFSLLISSLGNF